jgi:hypothetical protein
MKSKKEKLEFETMSLVDFARLCCFETNPLLVFALKEKEGYKLFCNFKGVHFFIKTNQISSFLEYSSIEEERADFKTKIENVRNSYSPIILLKTKPKQKKKKVEFFEVEDFQSLQKIALHELNGELQSAIFVDSKAWTIVNENDSIIIFFTNSFPKEISSFTDGENFSKLPKLGFVKIIHLKS